MVCQPIDISPLFKVYSDWHLYRQLWPVKCIIAKIYVDRSPDSGGAGCASSSGLDTSTLAIRSGGSPALGPPNVFITEFR